MASLSEKLLDFAGAISSAGTDAPDEYPEWSYRSFEADMSDIKELWSEIRPKLKQDVEKADFVDGKLQEAFAAFDAGEKEKGRKAMLAIYNLGIRTLK